MGYALEIVGGARARPSPILVATAVDVLASVALEVVDCATAVPAPIFVVTAVDMITSVALKTVQGAFALTCPVCVGSTSDVTTSLAVVVTIVIATARTHLHIAFVAGGAGGARSVGNFGGSLCLAFSVAALSAVPTTGAAHEHPHATSAEKNAAPTLLLTDCRAITTR